MKQKTIKYTNHCLQRMGQRGISKNLVQECVDLGLCNYQDSAYKYQYKNLVVVLAKNNVTVQTVYWKWRKN